MFSAALNMVETRNGKKDNIVVFSSLRGRQRASRGQSAEPLPGMLTGTECANRQRKCLAGRPSGDASGLGEVYSRGDLGNGGFLEHRLR